MNYVFRKHVPPLCLASIGASAQQNNYKLEVTNYDEILYALLLTFSF
jgi:hypothetical protein